MSATVAAPKNISPLIRAARWTLLLAGVWYGHSKLQSLRQSDAPLRKKQIETMTKEHAKQTAEKDRINHEGMLDLAKAAGVKVKN